MSLALRRIPGRRGKLLVAELERIGLPTLKDAAKQAGINLTTLRRLVFEDGTTMHLDTYEALKALGVGESALRK